MQKKARLKLRDVFIVIICSGVCAASLYMFWKDLNTSSTRNDKDQIATIEFKRKIAQRKYNDRVVWERLQQNSPLYNEDTIRTAEDAAATVTFKDGTVLELQENTMLQVAYSEDGGLNLSIGGGNIQVDTTASTEKSKVSLSMDNGSVFQLDSGSKLSAASNSSGENSFKLQAGNATVSNGKESQVISSGESVKVESSGQVKKEPLSVTSISDVTNLLAFNGEKSVAVLLKWNASSDYETENIIVETAADKEFSKIKNTYTVKNKNSLSLDSPLGKTYWRVYPQGQVDLAASGRISLEKVNPVSLTSPASGSAFSYRSDSDLPKVQLSWSGNDYADHYKVQVAKTADFASPIIDSDVKNLQASVKNLKEGTYYWRVTPFYAVNSIGLGKSSSANSFVIEKQEAVTPPKLSLPAQGGKLVFTAAKENPVTFQWKSDVKTADYKVQIATDKNFANLVYENNTKSNRLTASFTLKSLPAGTYYWKVERTSAEDDGIALSDIRAFSVDPYVPGENKLVYPPDNFAVEKQKLKNTAFMWKLASEYQKQETTSVFQVSKTLDFNKNLVEVKTTDIQTKDLDLNDGSYFWRVGVLSPYSDEMVYTSARSFKVLGQLASPVITKPLSGATLTVYGENPVRITWNGVSDADYYRVKVYDQNEKLVGEVSSTKFLYANLSLPPATYKCTVQAFTEETELSPRRSGKLSESKFTVRLPLPVKLMSPANNAKIDGLTAVRSQTTFTWQQGDKVARSQFVLKKRQSNGNMKTIQTLNNPKNQIRLSRLESGTYEWTITASSADGIPLDAEKSFTFTVNPLPQLASAKLVSPAANQKIGADYLKKNRSITFSWGNVKGATDYHFILYQKNANGSLKKVYEQKNLRSSEIKIKDLSILDIGDFEWNVTAYAHAKDGYEEQKSKAASGNFKIDFTLPGKVQTIDPGKLYGE